MKQLVLIALLLGACTKTITVEKPVPVHVEVPAPCPDEVESKRLIAQRPVPLRNTPMPASKEERVAKSEAQLGSYEADGGWGDQVVSALKRCQKK